MRYLRPVRIFVSLLFFLLLSLFFVDFRHFIPERFISSFLYIQFTPSVLLFVKTLGIAATGFIVVLIFALLFGRVYCSGICPLGTLQDFFSRFSNRFIIKRKRYRFSKPLNALRYGILVMTVLLFLFGSIFLVNLLDPYSSFGRIFTYLVKPVITGINNLFSGILGKWGYYGLYPVDLPSIRMEILAVSSAFLGLVGWLSFTRGRLYCNVVCPVGTILGMASRFSLVKIRLDENSCNQCGKCAAVCKSECIDVKNKQVDFSRCVACYNCLSSCPENGVRYSMKKVVKSVPAASKQLVNLDKRNFLFASTAMILGMHGRTARAVELINSQATTIREEKNFPVSPPGSLSLEGFNRSCTACTLCVSICPTHVLQPSFLEYGFGGLLQPHMDYHAGFCNFDCTRCGEICPTGAILPLSLEQKHVTQIGVATFIQENCIVVTDRTDCGACSEHCPTKAVNMIPWEDGLFIPEVTGDICVGCGACEYACPTVPYKAIYIDGNPLHLTASKPETESIEGKIDYGEFPF